MPTSLWKTIDHLHPPNVCELYYLFKEEIWYSEIELVLNDANNLWNYVKTHSWSHPTYSTCMSSAKSLNISVFQYLCSLNKEIRLDDVNCFSKFISHDTLNSLVFETLVLLLWNESLWYVYTEIYMQMKKLPW